MIRFFLKVILGVVVFVIGMIALPAYATDMTSGYTNSTAQSGQAGCL